MGCMIMARISQQLRWTWSKAAMNYSLCLPVDVAQHAQGWMPFPAQPKEGAAVSTAVMASIDDLRKRIQTLRSLAEQIGRCEPIDICITPFTHQHHPRGRENYDPPVLLEE